MHPEWAELLNGRIGIAGLALATSIASWVNAGTLFILLRRRLGILGGRRILRTLLKSGFASVAMGLFCWAIMHLHIQSWGALAYHERLARGVELAIAIAGGTAIYLGLARLLRMEEWRPFWAMLSREHPVEEE